MSPDKQADLILHGGIVHTMCPEMPCAQAVAMGEGRIEAVGSDSDVLNLKAANTVCRGLGGRCVVPGLTDSHAHFYGLGVTLMWLDISGCRSFAEVVERVRGRAEKTPSGTWILGAAWDQTGWPGGEYPHHRLLSEAVPEHPVWLKRVCGHARIANAKAMELAGIATNTPQPNGGEIVRDEHGEPTGVFVDTAQDLVEQHVPHLTEEQNREAVRRAGEHCLRLGLTSVHDMGISQTQLAFYKRMVDERSFPMRVYAMLAVDTGYTKIPDGPDTLGLDAFLAQGPLVGYGDGLLTLQTLKALSDGSLGGRSAAMLEDYRDKPGETGLLCFSQEFLEDLARRATKAGFQIATHAIGDRANRMVLDAYAAVQRELPEMRTLRPRIEHAQIVHPDDAARFGSLGVTPCMQGPHPLLDAPYAERRLGADRMDRMYNWRAFLNAGGRVPNGSDFPVANADPLYGMHCATTLTDRNGEPPGGWHPEKRMSRIEALRGYTTDAAWIAFEESNCGAIAPGMRADLTVLSHDILDEKTCPDLLETRVEATLLAGRIVFESP